MSVLDDVHDLLRRAVDALPPGERAPLQEADRRLAEPLRVAIAGRVKAGKSTLLNALVGEELAPTDASECTRIVTWYRRGLTYEVLAHRRSGGTVPVPFTRDGGAVTVQLGALDPADVEHLEVRWPSGRLEAMTLIDTPGIESMTADAAARVEELIDVEDDEPSPVDALLYLMQHTHPGDVRLLESFHDDELGRGSPVNAIGVLSRADEVGACRLDAIAVAERAAARYRATPELRRLCLTVVPVAGLAAQAATTLTEQQFRALGALAALPAEQLAGLLLTADRFAAGAGGPDGDGPAPGEVDGRALLDRLGLFAVRLSIDALRSGRVTSSRQLSSELLAASGLPLLRSVLETNFAGRSRVLRAGTALDTLERTLRRRGGDGETGAVLRDAERLRASVHEFTEIRVLTALRSGLVEVDPERRAALERVLGGDGDEAATRVDAGPEATDTEVLVAASEQLERWRRLADHPLAPRSLVDAAVAAVRSCEGILAELAPRP